MGVLGGTQVFLKGQGIEGHLYFLHFSRKGRGKEQTASQETGMKRIFPACLREGVQARGFAALDTGTSKFWRRVDLYILPGSVVW